MNDAILRKKKLNIDLYLCLIILLPILLLVANPSWFFPYTGGPTDGWLNNLYFYSYGIPQLFVNYKATRLSWILKGWLVHHYFPPLTAYYLLNITILYLCTIPFYFIVKILFDRRIAFLATLAFATYSQFHSIVSFEWDYHTHDATANILLTLLFLLLATMRPRWKLYLFLAGTTCVSAFQSPFILIHGISVIFWYCYLNRKNAKHSLITSTAMFTLGAIAMTATYGAINYLAGGAFLYFLPSIPGQFGWPAALRTYAYQVGYWQSFTTMLLHNKGIVIPLYALLLSIAAWFYLNRKKPDFPYKNSTTLCWVAFFLCIPIPTVFQILGWPVLSLQHWMLGMDQFVFLGVAGIFATFLPVGHTDKKMDTGVLLFAFVLFCSALVFGYSLQKTFLHFFLTFSTLQALQVCLLFLMLFLVCRFKQFKQYLPVLIILTVPVFFTHFLLAHKISSALLFLVMLYFLWKHRNQPPPWLNRVIFLNGVVLFPLLSLLHAHIINLTWDPALQTLLLCLFLFLPMLYACFYWEKLKNYTVALCLTVLFAMANLYSASIPIALYSVNNKCGYFRDMYSTVMQGQKVLSDFSNRFKVLLWFRYTDSQPPSKACVSKLLQFGRTGIPMGEGGVLGALSVTAAAGGTTFGLNTFEKQRGLLRKTLNTLPNSAYWSQYAPAAIKAQPNKSMINMIPLSLLRTKSLSHFSSEKFWLHILPNHYKWAIMDHSYANIQLALNSFKQYGYHMADKKLYKIKSGVVSYYILTGYVEKGNAAS